jgi:hypothetical protein
MTWAAPQHAILGLILLLLVGPASFAPAAVGNYVSYLGGSGDESPASIAADPAGNIYVTGTTSSTNFPGAGAADRSLGNDTDAFVAKFSPNGDLIYATYVGGSCPDAGTSIAVDPDGNAYITGRTDLCFFGNEQGGVMVAKLDPAGMLIYRYTFGAVFADTSYGLAIAIDAAGHAYVAGSATASDDFPTTTNAFQRSPCGGFLGEGFVARVNSSGDGLDFCTYLCGTGHDSANAIALDAAGNIWVAGRTASHDFRTVHPFQPDHRGGPIGDTAFVSKLDPTASTLLYSTYLGGSYGDVALALAVDAQGNAYVTGETQGGDFPTTPGVIQRTAPFPLCFPADFCSDAFVTKFSPNGAVIYSTFLAGEGDDAGIGIAVDAAGQAYVVGATASIYFPIRSAWQQRNHGITDAFVTKLNAHATRILVSSYLGGGRPAESRSGTEGDDEGSGIVLGTNGQVYISGRTIGFQFPVTPGAFQTNSGGGDCFLGIEPCGDSFFARLNLAGGGVVSPPSVEIVPAESMPGGTITATWAGIDAPSANDLLVLYPLGEGSLNFIFLPNYPTTGEAAGTLPLVLPETLAPGSYELRLQATDPDFPALLKVVARSEPVSIVGGVTLWASLEPDHLLHIRIFDLRAGSYRVEASETLDSPQWQVIDAGVVESGQVAEFRESFNLNRPRRFYRVSQ